MKLCDIHLRDPFVFAENGGAIDGISFENIESETTIHAGNWWGKGEGFVICADNSDGSIKNISFKNNKIYVIIYNI